RMVGKALADPLRGITQLNRVGVVFTEQQRDQIEAMTKLGDVAGAQRMILRELEGQFGGVAEAMAQGPSAAIVQMKNAFGDFKETIGGAIAPVFGGIARSLKGFFESAGPPIARFLTSAAQQVGGFLAMFKNG